MEKQKTSLQMDVFLWYNLFMSLLLSIIGYGVLAVVAVMDKFLLSQAKVQPALYTFYSTVFVLPVVLLYPFGVTNLAGFDWLLALLSGITFAFGLWAMFLGFEKSEVSHVGPLIGAATPLFVLFFSRYFLGEFLSGRLILACMFLIVGSLIISFEKCKKHSGWHTGMFWGILSGCLFAVSHVSAKYLYDSYGFLSGFVWTRAAMGVLGLLLLFHPAVYRALFFPSWFDKIKNKIFTYRQTKNNLWLVGINKILSVVGVVLIQYAIAIGSVSLVNALNGLQYAFLVIVVLIFSKFRPKIFKESYVKGEIFQELFAVGVILIGLFLLV